MVKQSMLFKFKKNDVTGDKIEVKFDIDFFQVYQSGVMFIATLENKCCFLGIIHEAINQCFSNFNWLLIVTKRQPILMLIFTQIQEFWSLID